MNDDLKELLRDKADEMRLPPRIPQSLLRRSRRRRVLNTALAGSLVAVLGVGAFVGARAAMNGGEPAHGGLAHEPSVTPTATVTPTPSPAGPPAAIVVAEPSPGDTVSSPVHILGTADVFEAVVSIQIIAGDGTKVADTTTMADCSKSCPGPYSANVAFSVTKEQAGTILVFEASAKDGNPIHVVRIPVTLEPGGVPPVSAGFDGMWPADSDASLAQLQADAAAGTADWALQPTTTAEKFATDIAHWSPSKIRVHAVQPGGNQSYVELWNTDMGSYSPQISLDVQLRKDGAVWIVRHVEDGLFDLLDPSTRQDVIVGTSQSIQGQFAQGQTPAGWTVTAVLVPAGDALAPSPQETAADIPISGDGFSGSIDVPATPGGDVELIVTVTSGNGETLGMSARRFSTAG